MDIFRAIQILAAKSVRDNDGEFKLRQIFRWYSKNFHTPLHLVEELPIEDVLQHYFEYVFSEMEPEELQETISELIETQEDRLQRLINEEKVLIDEQEFKELAKTFDIKTKSIGNKPIDKSIIPKTDAQVNKPMPEPTLSSGNVGQLPILPDIKIEYVDDNLLNEEIERINEGPPRPNRKKGSDNGW